MRRRLKKLFDVEMSSMGWDIRLWPLNWRLYKFRRPTSGGVERQLGIYQLGEGECSFEWWVSR
jgi:hypothetical protein